MTSEKFTIPLLPKGEAVGAAQWQQAMYKVGTMSKTHVLGTSVQFSGKEQAAGVSGGVFEELSKSVKMAPHVPVFGAWGGMPIIAIGPKGGKIVGYGKGHTPIYAGSQGAQKLIEQMQASHLAHTIFDWLKHLGFAPKGVAGGATIIVDEEEKKLLSDSFGVHGTHTEYGYIFSVAALKPFIGHALKPKAENAAHVMALVAAPEDEAAAFPEIKTLKEVPAGHYAGSHGNRLFQAPDGRKFIFKDKNPTIARAEEAVGRIASLVLGAGKAQVARYVQLDGKDGALIPLLDGDAPKSHGAPPTEWLQEHFAALVQNQVLDWVVANHDTHAGNFLTHESEIVAIDKGQAWKWVGEDKLSPTWEPKNPSPPVYNALWAKFAAGEVKGDPVAAATHALAGLAKVSVDHFRAIIAPYIATKAGHSGEDTHALEQKLIKRFQEAHHDVEKLLKKVTGKPVKITVATPEAEAPTFTIPHDVPAQDPGPAPQVIVAAAPAVAETTIDVPETAPASAGPLPLGTKISTKKKYPGLEKKGATHLTVVSDNEFVVEIEHLKQVTTFNSLSAACDHVWALGQGYASAAEYKAKHTVNKVPSGGGWKFWGLSSAPALPPSQTAPAASVESAPIPAPPMPKKPKAVPPAAAQPVVEAPSPKPEKTGHQGGPSADNWETMPPSDAELWSWPHGTEISWNGKDGAWDAKKGTAGKWLVTNPAGVEMTLHVDSVQVKLDHEVTDGELAVQLPKQHLAAAPFPVLEGGALHPVATLDAAKHEVGSQLAWVESVDGKPLQIVATKQPDDAWQGVWADGEKTAFASSHSLVSQMKTEALGGVVLSKPAPTPEFDFTEPPSVPEFDFTEAEAAPTEAVEDFDFAMEEEPAVPPPPPAPPKVPTKTKLSHPVIAFADLEADANGTAYSWINANGHEFVATKHTAGFTLTKDGFEMGEVVVAKLAAALKDKAEVWKETPGEGAATAKLPKAPKVPASVNTKVTKTPPNAPAEFLESKATWSTAKTDDGEHLIGEKPATWPAWVPPPGVWVEGEFNKQPVWFTTNTAGFQNDGTASGALSFTLLTNSGKLVHGAEQPAAQAQFALNALAQKLKPGTKGVDVFPLAQTNFFGPGESMHFDKPADAAPKAEDVILTTAEDMPPEQKAQLVKTEMALHDALSTHALAGNPAFKIKQANKSGHMNVILDAEPGKTPQQQADTLTALAKEFDFEKDIFQKYGPMLAHGGAFMTVPDAVFEKQVLVVVPAVVAASTPPNLPAAAPAAQPSSPPPGEKESAPNWDWFTGKEKTPHETITTQLKAAPVGTKITWTENAGQYAYSLTKTKPYYWTGAPENTNSGYNQVLHSDAASEFLSATESADVGSQKISVVPVGAPEPEAPSPAPVVADEPAPVAYVGPSKFFKSWSQDKMEQAFLQMPIGAKLLFADGTSMMRVGVQSGNPHYTKWEKFGSDGHSYGPGYGSYAAYQAVKYKNGATVVLPGQAAPPPKVAKPKPAPKPIKKSDEQIAKELKQAELVAWAKSKLPITDADLLHQLAHLQHKLSAEPFYARIEDASTGTLLLGDGDTSFGAKLAQAGLQAMPHETPLGTLFKCSVTALGKSVGDVNAKVEGPDGKQYPAGTTFATTTETKSVAELLPGEQGFHSLVPHNKNPDALILKAHGTSPLAKQHIKTMLAKYNVTPKFPEPLAGSYHTLTEISKADAEKIASTTTTHGAVIPKQPKPFVAKSVSTGSYAQAGAKAVNNYAQLANIKTLIPEKFGSSIRLGKAGIFRDGHVYARRVQDAQGKQFYEFNGDIAGLTKDTSKLKLKLSANGAFVTHSSQTKKHAVTGWKVHNYDPDTGLQVEGSDLCTNYNITNAWTGETSAGTRITVPKCLTFRDTFIARVPVDADVETELHAVFSKLGIDADEAMAEPTADDERLVIKAHVLRAMMGVVGYNTLFEEPEHLKDEAYLDEQLAAHGATKLATTAELRYTAGSFPHAVITDAEDAKKLEDAGAMFGHIGASAGGIFNQIIEGFGFSTKKVQLLNGIAGIGGSGTPTDFERGGAEGTMARIATPKLESADISGVGEGRPQAIFHPRVFARTDYHIHNGDAYGSKLPGEGHYESSKHLGRYAAVKGITATNNELLFEHGLAVSDMAGVVCYKQSQREELLGLFKKAGIGEVNGIPLEQFVIMKGGTGGFNRSWITKNLHGLQEGVLP